MVRVVSLATSESGTLSTNQMFHKPVFQILLRDEEVREGDMPKLILLRLVAIRAPKLEPEGLFAKAKRTQ